MRIAALAACSAILLAAPGLAQSQDGSAPATDASARAADALARAGVGAATGRVAVAPSQEAAPDDGDDWGPLAISDEVIVAAEAAPDAPVEPYQDAEAASEPAEDEE